MSDGIERRRFTRFPFQEGMALHLKESKKPVSALDISREGIGFIWDEALAIGTDIEVILDFSDMLHLPLLLTVTMCRRDEGGVYRIGAIMQSEDSALLEELIQSLSDELDLFQALHN